MKVSLVVVVLAILLSFTLADDPDGSLKIYSDCG
jgi:hypothetical protein